MAGFDTVMGTDLAFGLTAGGSVGLFTLKDEKINDEIQLYTGEGSWS